MGLVKSVSKYLNDTPRGSLLTRWQARLHKRSNSSTPIQDSGFTPFWEKAEITGIMKLKELLCEKHMLRLHSLKHRVYAFVCEGCGARFYVHREIYVQEFGRENPDLAKFRIHWWEEGKEAEVVDFFAPRNPGNTRVLGLDYGDPTPA